MFSSIRLIRSYLVSGPDLAFSPQLLPFELHWKQDREAAATTRQERRMVVSTWEQPIDNR